METASSVSALAGRKKLVNPNSGAPRWRTPFIGVPVRTDDEVRDGPLAFLIEMVPNSGRRGSLARTRTTCESLRMTLA